MHVSVILQQRVTPETQAAFVISCFYVTFSNLCSGKPEQTLTEKKQNSSQLISKFFSSFPFPSPFSSPSLSPYPSPLSPSSPDNGSLTPSQVLPNGERVGLLYKFSEVKRKGKRDNCQMKASVDAFKCSTGWSGCGFFLFYP